MTPAAELPATLRSTRLPQEDTSDVESDTAAVALLNFVLHLRGQDRRVAPVAQLARAEGREGYPVRDVWQGARRQLVADPLFRVWGRRRHRPSLRDERNLLQGGDVTEGNSAGGSADWSERPRRCRSLSAARKRGGVER